MMDFRQLLGGDMAMPAPGQDMESNDTAETVQISSLALLKVRQFNKFWIANHLKLFLPLDFCCFYCYCYRWF